MTETNTEVLELRRQLAALACYISGVTPDANTQTPDEVEAVENYVESIVTNVRMKLNTRAWRVNEPTTATSNLVPWPDPTEFMTHDPAFIAIWNVIKTWDIAVPGAYNGYCGATGNHVRAILEALPAFCKCPPSKIV